MQEHTRRLPTEHSTQHVARANEEDSMLADEMIRKICGDLPEWAVTLRGLRNREGLTQAALGNLLGIAQTNISQMELGKRQIGKTIAKRLADLFHTDYRLFL
jgi:DNA-binding XRE family transcriptional regulator